MRRRQLGDARLRIEIVGSGLRGKELPHSELPHSPLQAANEEARLLPVVRRSSRVEKLEEMLDELL